MLAWLADAFSSPTSKAQLVAIIVSALIAIAVLLLNQHFTIKRSRKDVLVKKIEEAYQSALAYERHAKQLLAAIYRGGRNERGHFVLDPTLIDAMNDEVEKIEMLLGLHFPSVAFDKARYYAGPTLPVLEIAVKQKIVSEDESLRAAEDTRSNVARNAKEIKSICSQLMRKHKH